MGIAFKNVKVIEELERLKIKYEHSSDEWVMVVCPFHGDQDPSLAISLEKRVYRCHGCKRGGTIIDFISKVTGQSQQATIAELSKRYNLETTKGLDPTQIEEWHSKIFSASKLMEELYERAITDDDVRTFRLGFDQKTSRITIPIYDRSGNIVNVRKYAPHLSGAKKFLNTKGRGKLLLYPIEQLKYKKILLVGGEIKAIVAIRQLNHLGIGVITTTAGEGNWKPELNQEFRDKEVIICFDIDREGQRGAQRVCAELYGTAESVGILHLPLDINDYPHGDINDFVRNGGSLEAIIDQVEFWEPRWEKNYDEDPTAIEFGELINAKHTAKKVKFAATVASISNTPYAIPQRVRINCTQDQKVCGLCPVATLQKEEFEIHAENESLLGIIDARRNQRRQLIAEAVGVPALCKAHDIEEESYYSMEKVRISQCLDVKEGTIQEKDYQIAIHNGPLSVNSSYEFTGRLYPSPETQALTFLLSGSDKKEDALDSFRLEDSEELRIFQAGKNIKGKLNEIYADFEANVTQIYRRKQMHLAIDLAYHSPLWVEGIKGWVEVIIVGDTGQGKTQTASRMRDFYKLGEFVSCNNVSFAGLVGGLKQYTGNKGWWIEWGVLPQNDRQLVILEEFKGLSTQSIGQLTDIRSSGIVRIEKIEKRSTLARTRLVCLSNPRDKTLSAYPYGILAVQDLVGRQEDIRRFDFVYIVSKNAVPNLPALLGNPPKAEHKFREHLCRKLLLWAWTSNVVMEHDAKNAVLEYSEQLNQKYECELELITPGTTHEKLYRLSAALAARLFNHDEQLNILVEKHHVDFMFNFMCGHYDDPDCDYKTYAQFSQRKSQINEEEMKGVFQSMGDAKDVIRYLLASNRIDAYSIQNLASSNSEISRDFLRKLLLNNALIREQFGYRLAPSFIAMLKKFESNGALDRPAHIKEEF